MRRLAVSAVFAIVLTGCGATPTAPASTIQPETSTSLGPTTTSLVLEATTPTTNHPVETTTTIQPAAELIITGTGQVYTLEESQHFGEFGPLIWNLVTTLNGTDEIEHHPTYEWVSWGSLWGGRLNGARPWREVFGVTDLDAVDPEAIAAAVPTGTVIVLRQVRWSLDQLDHIMVSLRPEDMADDPIFCEVSKSPETGVELVATAAQIEFLQSELPSALGNLFDAIRFTEVDECHYPTERVWVYVMPSVVNGDYPPE